MSRLYFRYRHNGALIFRVEENTRDGRMELSEIAAANHRNGTIRVMKDCQLSEAEACAIRDWISVRSETEELKELTKLEELVESLNRSTHWVQTQDNTFDLDEITDRLILAMYDLRKVLLTKKGSRMKG